MYRFYVFRLELILSTSKIWIVQFEVIAKRTCNLYKANDGS